MGRNERRISLQLIAWLAKVRGVAKSPSWLRNWTHTHMQPRPVKKADIKGEVEWSIITRLYRNSFSSATLARGKGGMSPRVTSLGLWVSVLCLKTAENNTHCKELELNKITILKALNAVHTRNINSIWICSYWLNTHTQKHIRAWTHMICSCVMDSVHISSSLLSLNLEKQAALRQLSESPLPEPQWSEKGSGLSTVAQAFRAVDHLPYHLNFLPESENHMEAPGHSEPTQESKRSILSCFWAFHFSTGVPNTGKQKKLLLFSPFVVSKSAIPWTSMPAFPILHYLLELAQTHVHWVSDAIQSSHPLLPPSPPPLNLSQHQGLFQWVSHLHQMAKVLEPQLQDQSFQLIFRVNFLQNWLVYLLAVQGTLKSFLQHHSSKASILQCLDFFMETSLFKMQLHYIQKKKTRLVRMEGMVMYCLKCTESKARFELKCCNKCLPSDYGCALVSYLEKREW